MHANIGIEMPIQQNQLENLFGALALSVTDAVAREIEEAEGAYGSDTFALVLLQHWQVLRSDMLARQLRLAQSSTVRLVDRLEQAGLVQRQVGTDRRTVMLSLTSEGLAKAESILIVRQNVLSRLVGMLSEEESEALHGIASKLLAELTVGAVSGEQNCRLCDERACDLEQCPVERRYQTFADALRQ